MSKTKRKIAILGTKGIPAAYGGFETFAQEISVRLVEKGISVTVFCEDDGRLPSRPSEYKGVALEYINTRRNLGPFRTIAYDIHSLFSASTRFEYIYMLGYGASAFCFIPRLFGSNVWINMDGIEWQRSKWSSWAQAYLRLCEFFATKTANRLICDAEGIKRHLSLRYKKLPDCSVIAYGASPVARKTDDDYLRSLGLSGGKYLLVVCRLEPENHVAEIVAGFTASRIDFPLVVLGDIAAVNTYTDSLKKLASDRVIFLGTVFDQHKLAVLRTNATAYLHGHSVGGTNPSLLEAMASGNLIIAHDNVFNRETAGDSASYFKDTETLIDVIRSIGLRKDDESMRKALAKEIVASRYSWDLITDQYLQLLD